ncbi:DMT family transporter [Bartonella sp. HY329]|uniref:DMT family transporter n=1 Tax=unclassified Bartonella TaxID=2645622 RepID=UPI0021C87C3A|nr:MULTISPECIES: DMT family transporter [unclassified Bartonella]UXM95133.1 DMT family transporter [Bartonella sp. HY329]UXN09456.1 DMT family transporter [Bartonella sp. HY328]
MNKTALLSFIFLGFIWGTNFVFIKWAYPYFGAAQITLLCVIFGFIPVFFYALYKKALHVSQLRYCHHFIIMALLVMVIYYFAYAEGAIRLPVSTAGLLSGTAPLFTFLCALLFLKEQKITWLNAFAIFIGFCGIALLGNPFAQSDSFDMIGIGYMIIASLSLGVSFVYAQKFLMPLNIPIIASTTYQLGFAIIILLPFIPLNNIAPIFNDPKAWIGLIIGLGLLSTGVAYVAYYYIVEKSGAIFASSIVYVPPIVALALDIFAYHHNVGLNSYLAIILVLAAVALLELDSFKSRAQAF